MNAQFRRLWTTGQVQNVFNRFEKAVEDKVIEGLKYLGEEFVGLARMNGNYMDRTGNLRSSVGYIILKNGRPIHENIQSTNKDDDSNGVNTARQFSRTIANDYNLGYVLVVFAGMEYAYAVESKGYDVITGSIPDKNEVENLLKQVIGKAA